MTVTKKRDEEDKNLLTNPSNHSQQQNKRQQQQTGGERSKTTLNGRRRMKQESFRENERNKIPKPREDIQMLRPKLQTGEEQFSYRLEGIRIDSEMEFLGYQTIVYVIFLMSAVVLIVADYGISDDCQNLKRFDMLFFVTAGAGFFVMMWTVLFRSLKPECFLSTCSCFPLLIVNLMLLAMCITLGAGELFNPDCGSGWARGWLTLYWVWFVFIFPLIPLVLMCVKGYYFYWYHLIVMQVLYITHALDIWLRGENDVIPEYIPTLTWFFIGSSVWVSMMYLTTYKQVAIVWVILGFGIVFWSAEAVWKLGGPHGLEAQILLVVFNLLVFYILCYLLWEALSSLLRKEVLSIGVDKEEEALKIRLTLRSSFVSLFKRSFPEKTRSQKKSKSGWTLVNNKDCTETVGIASHQSDSMVVNEEQVETQILDEYDNSSDDEVRMFIQENDETPQSPVQHKAPVKHLLTPTKATEKMQLQPHSETHPRNEEDVGSLQASSPLLITVKDETSEEKEIRKFAESSPKGVTLSKQKCAIDTTSSQTLLNSALSVNKPIQNKVGTKEFDGAVDVTEPLIAGLP